MCGIAGYMFLKRDISQPQNVLERMGNAIRHRGPDDDGIWHDAAQGIGMVHRRLSIVDLSEAGHQPMFSDSGRFVIAFNGEVYNHGALRRLLESEGGAPGVWRGHSDTETLLACIEAWGLETTLSRAVGMFAISLWDRNARTLSLARDRLGEKPLYYGISNGMLIFGSELRALRQHPDFQGEISRSALALYMRYGCVPGSHCIFQGISKLLPGHILVVTTSSLGRDELPLSRPYWSLSQVIEKGLADPFPGDETKAIRKLEDLLVDAVKLQQVADVPLGAFLSGGVDSSLVVSLMQAHSSRPVNTFTIGFDEHEFNEAHHAAEVARHLGTQHTELYLTGKDALNVIPKLGIIFDEPFADASQIPTRLVCELAQRSVTVALSGDAGDELFGGYNRYLMAGALWEKMEKLPQSGRVAMAGMMSVFSPQRWEDFYSGIKNILPSRWHISQPADKIHKLIELLGVKNKEELYRHLVSQWRGEIVIGAVESPMLPRNEEDWPASRGFEQWMMYMDTQTYLPDDILVKVDRAAMSVGLETRVPMLDHRVVEFAWSLPMDLKIRNGQGKWVLRQVLYRHVPRELIERPKSGFAVPLDRWLRGPLREWAENLLTEARLKNDGYLNVRAVRDKWQEHLSGKRNWQYALWNVLMFQVWLDEFRAQSDDVSGFAGLAA